MSTQVQYRRGTATENNAFTGALAEITVDTSNWTLRVHDGVTAGGGGNLATVSYVTAQLAALSANAITFGTSNVQIPTSNGNIRFNVAGTSNVMVVNSTGVDITGNLTVTGNATLTGNILGDRVQNGTTSFDIQTQNGNANISVNGTSNIAVFASTGLFVTGVTSATGNVTSTANVTGGNITTAGLITATGNITSTGNITGAFLLGNASFVTGLSASKIFNGTTEANIGTSSGNANISVGGTSNVAVFASTGLYVTGLITATGNITSTANVTGGNLISTGTITTAGNIVSSAANATANIGSATTYFNTVHAKATSAQYADVAEYYASDANYEPGTVVIFGGGAEITISTDNADNRVAGVVSTNPAYIMNAGLACEYAVPVALAGRVPTRVIGPVKKGNMMISAGNGYAQACATPAVGTVIGKSLENFSGATGVIEVVVGRI
jgi:hypothetical protein